METFKQKLGEVYDVRAAIALLSWDQEVNMPPKGAPGRGKQLATLSAMAHRLFTDSSMGAALQELQGTDGLTADEAKLVAETHYDYERATKLPEAFVQEFAEAQSAAYEAWVDARAKADFPLFKPHLEKIVALVRQKSDYLGYEGSPYNALLEEFERGMTAERLKEIFGELAPKQSALVERIVNAADQPDQAWLKGEWNEQAQWDFTIEILKDMGYDFEAGRQDKSVHPFTTNFDVDDVRITTRINPRELFSSLTGSMHEGGHALYEQGFREEDRRTTLAAAPSLGIHESQSRMWENMIGRSLPFWKHYAPRLRALYPGRLDNISPKQMHRAINHVAPSFIRVEADECTYNLHVILRFEIESALLDGNLPVDDIPTVWNAKVKEYLGLDVPNDREGCLQDIHWSHGLIGYFPTYALGNLYAAQLFEKIEADIPRLWQEVENGNFAPLLEWLRRNVHEYGRRKTATQIVEDASGHKPGVQPFLNYLEGKYSRLYSL